MTQLVKNQKSHPSLGYPSKQFTMTGGASFTLFFNHFFLKCVPPTQLFSQKGWSLGFSSSSVWYRKTEQRSHIKFRIFSEQNTLKSDITLFMQKAKVLSFPPQFSQQTNRLKRSEKAHMSEANIEFSTNFQDKQTVLKVAYNSAATAFSNYLQIKICL